MNSLWAALRPTEAKRAWLQVREGLGIPGRCLEVIYDFGAHAAVLARAEDDVARLLPRGTRVMVVDLAGPAARAAERLHQFRTTEEKLKATLADGRQATSAGKPAAAGTPASDQSPSE